ncbi:ATP-binding protein [Listeria costaricensis]|uniref:ATP-binding protein n=1 Tax=Listeria costaricensis TaxID=2026604 RepID=UPI000C0843EC|nr:AAA family ATPase [Listeria costaricensis]
MKITEIAILGYGKWQNTTFRDIQAFQMIYGENEAGKSTIMAFIHSILFGFPTKQQSIPRMEPKNQGPYGGRLTLSETSLGTVVVERLKGKATGDVNLYLEDGTIAGEERLAEILADMDRASYEAIFSFDIHGLQQINQMKQSEFEKYLLQAGTIGSDKLLRAVADLEKQMDQLFKPSGRNPVINQQLQRTKESHQAYIQAKSANQKYQQLKKELNEMEQQLHENQAAATANQLQRLDLETLRRKWPVYEEWQGLKSLTEAYGEQEFPTDGVIRLEHLLTELGQKQNRHMQLKERQQTLKENPAFEQKEEADALLIQIETSLNEWPLYQDKAKRREELKKRLREETILEGQLAKEIGLTDFDIDVSQTALQQAEELAVAEQKYQQRADRLNTQKSEKEQLIRKKEIQLERIEAELWPADKIAHFEAEYQSRRRTKAMPPNGQKGAIISGGMGVILLIMASFLSVWWLGLIGGLGLLVSAGFFFSNRPKSGQETSQVEMMAYFEQKQKRQNWQNLLAETDELALALAEYEKEADKLAADSRKHQVAEQQFLASLGLSAKGEDSLVLIAQKRLSCQEFHKQNQQRRKEIEQINLFQKEWAAVVSGLSVTTTNAPIEEQVAEMRHFLKRNRAEAEAGIKIQEKLEQIEQDIQLLERDMDSLLAAKQALYRDAKVKDETSFRQAAKQAQDYLQAKERMQLLKGQLPDEQVLQLSQYDRQTELEKQDLALAEIAKSLAQEEHDLRNERMKNVHQIEQLEEGGTYSELVQHYYMEKNELQELAEQWMELKTAQALIYETMNHLQEDKFPKARQFAANYFAELTNGAYKDVRFQDEKLEVVRQDDLHFRPEELSQATKEQLYLAVRFTLIDIISEDYPLPLLIDDGFVNFDAKRLDAIMKLLEKRKGKNQILFFTCHKQADKYFSEQESLVLY